MNIPPLNDHIRTFLPIAAIIGITGLALYTTGCRPAETEKSSAALHPETSEHPLIAVRSIIANGKANAVLVVSQINHPYQKELATYLANILFRATGVQLPISEASAASTLGDEITRIYIGRLPEGAKAAALPDEGYRVVVTDKAVYLAGNDTIEGAIPNSQSQPTRWAINLLLEKYLGVRWLWPGDLGTYVPKQPRFELPLMDVSYQPRLVIRRLRISAEQPFSTDSELNHRMRRESMEWIHNHQGGRRTNTPPFGHAFEHWYAKYGETHPDYFAVTPPGIQQPAFNQPGRVKLRLSNPAVVEQIAAEYKAAGAPAYWCVCPNDGKGFDLDEETLSWDLPQGQSKEAIWTAQGNLTARYVTFWNRVYARLKEINPDVALSTYAYHAYKTPPTAERPLVAKAAIAIVPGFKDFDLWQGWAQQEGTQSMFLRPNWGHVGANAPYLPLDEAHRFLQFAWANKMAGFDNDSINGYWSTQGLIYYLWARMLSQPDLSKEAIIAEYTSAFGAGTPKVKEYFDYWLQRSREFALPESYGEHDPEYTKGKYAQLVKEGKTELNFVRGPRYALPYLYTDEVLAPAFALLKEATALVKEDTEAAARVAFLENGLLEMIATRDLIATSRAVIKAPRDQGLRKKLAEEDAALSQLRRELNGSHAIWGERATQYEERYRVPMRPSMMDLPELNMDGL